MKVETILHKLYYIEHNYDGIQKLTKKAKAIDNNITQKEVEAWLKKQNTYQVNTVKPTKHSDFLPIFTESHSSWQLDLTFIPQYKTQNNGNYVLFTAIHINSRFAYVSYATNKKAPTILQLMKVFNDKFQPNKLDGDKGSEYINKQFIEYLKKEQIEYNFYKSDSHKLGIINRFHRTLKEKIQKFISASGSTKWITVIDDIVKSYNNTYHRGIRAKPIEVFKSPVLQDLIIDEKKRTTERLKENEKPLVEGDFVRTIKNLSQFENRMTTKNSAEIYRIVKVKANTIDALDEKQHTHTFKKTQVIKINPNIENAKKDESVKARKVNRDIRLIRKEDLIDAPMPTRTRPKQK